MDESTLVEVEELDIKCPSDFDLKEKNCDPGKLSGEVLCNLVKKMKSPYCEHI